VIVRHKKLSANAIAQKFRSANPPIIGRIKDDRFLLDLRAIFDGNDLLPNFHNH
jgi:seryl-tRNA(Sec) selenium transferase